MFKKRSSSQAAIVGLDLDPGHIAAAEVTVNGSLSLKRGAVAPLRPGVLRAEKLVNMKTHDYRTEPNLQFTPDGKWLIFRSNMHGPIHTYAVAVDKAA